MKKRFVVGAACCGLALSVFSGGQPEPGTVSVDFGKTVRAIKPMNAVNNGPHPKRADQTRSNFDSYRAAKIPFARNHDAAFDSTYGGEHTVDVHAIFPNFDADPERPESYDFFYTDQYCKSIQDSGTEVFYRLGSKIEHGLKKYGTLPPKDFKKWAVVCEHIVRHYTEGWANGHTWNIRYWEIWNEPDLDADNAANKRTWGGTEAQFFDLYETAAKHLKARFPQLKIGGPALAGNEAWAQRFLTEMARRSVPMDFFSWHIYTTCPAAVGDKARRVRKLMDDAGYARAESILNEWNYVRGWSDAFVYSVKTIGGIKGAAFTAAAMSVGQDNPVDMLMYYDARPCVFNGLWDYYTFEPLKGYYPFVLFSRLAALGQQAAAEIDGKHLYATAAKGADGSAGVLCSYYVEDDRVTAVKDVAFALAGLDAAGRSVTVYTTDEGQTLASTCVGGKDAPLKTPLHVAMKPNSFVYIEIR